MTQNTPSPSTNRLTYTAAERAWISEQAAAVTARRQVQPMHFPARPTWVPLGERETVQR